MRLRGVLLESLGVYLPESRPLSDAVDAGEMTTAELDKWGWTGVAQAGAISPPDMAVAAGTDAVAASSISAQRFQFLIHASSLYQGSIMWPAHHYVQRHTIGSRGTAFEVRQACSGGLAALQVAASLVGVQPHPVAALVTGADNHFWYDRFEWVRHHVENSRNMPLPGDAAHALVITNIGGFATLDSIATGSVPEFEEAFRLPGPRFPVDIHPPTVPEIHAITAAGNHDIDRLRALSFRAARTALETAEHALTEAGLSPDDIAYFMPGFATSSTINDFVANRLRLPQHAGLTHFGRTVGHLSVSDHAAGLAYLVAQQALRPGDRLLIGAAGLAASMSYLVVTVDRVPELALPRRPRAV